MKSVASNLNDIAGLCAGGTHPQHGALAERMNLLCQRSFYFGEKKIRNLLPGFNSSEGEHTV